jgi:hypothetical protein
VYEETHNASIGEDTKKTNLQVTRILLQNMYVSYTIYVFHYLPELEHHYYRWSVKVSNLKLSNSHYLSVTIHRRYYIHSLL